MKRLTPVLLLLCTVVASLPARADQTPFVNVGATNQVSVERRQFGDVHTRIDQNTVIPDTARLTGVSVTYPTSTTQATTVTLYVPAPGSTLSHTAQSSCDGGSYDYTCVGVAAINSCTFSSLSSVAQQAIRTLLGYCTLSCITATGTLPWGEGFTTYGWTCANPHQANCVVLAGMEHRVDVIEQASGCQF